MTQEAAGLAARHAHAAAVPGGRRILEVDALRGFALCGIFLVNVLVMAGPYEPAGGVAPATGPDLVAQWLVTAFVATKFYLLFSFLFGYSFTLQMTSAERAGARFAPRMLRRLLALFVLGVLHAALLYTGDILTTYAVLGLVLFFSRNAAPARVWRAALWVYGVFAVLLLLLGAAGAADPVSGAEFQAETAELTEAYRGDAADVIAANVGAWSDVLIGALSVSGQVVAAFLVGFVAGKRQLLAGDTVGADRLRRIRTLGLAVGVPGGLFMAAGTSGPLSERWETVALAVGMVSAPALTAAYASAILLWVRTPRGARAASWLAPAGRMALTNYLLQSLVMALVFTGYGFGLYGRAGAAAAVCGALAFYAAQLFLSARLMRRHRLGPVEWALRAVTLAGRPTPAVRPDEASSVRDNRHRSGG
ncbi:DUF418 domain-containing protein [Streptomyces sp. A3M-1-3]|uniref:DUF418 domain-containing protein n=1 Tax=Streptomyces sp. A3M-1-3 TaxID=2962044 RepID=UPI0020B73852|nr:DUF418 domain-containing protein [Streptomyces sp. A3M-1-3]MCP3819580.1 DUF418 domain-containing protein [Streptomyces sp. A3M-1-3]